MRERSPQQKMFRNADTLAAWLANTDKSKPHFEREIQDLTRTPILTTSFSDLSWNTDLETHMNDFESS